MQTVLLPLPETSSVLHARLKAIAVVGTAVLLASLFGILTRPVGFLAAFWPANAILLGLMVRNTSYASLPTWLSAFFAYLVADLATGSELAITLWLTSANMVGVITGYLLFGLLGDDDRALRRPLSVLYLFAISAAAALAAALTGGGAATVLFGRDFISGLEFWFVTELVNSLVILPVILAFPGFRQFGLSDRRVRRLRRDELRQMLPAALLLCSAAATVVVGGPGAIAFPVPALVWCALSYTVFTTSALTLMLCGWMLVAVSTGLLAGSNSPDALGSASSVRLGIALIALGPLSVASINAAREELLRKLTHSANHDMLTGTLSRRAFMDHGYEIVRKQASRGAPTSLLMLDVDHFKSVNDHHGHAAGDRVLTEFARLVSLTVRKNDLFGRIGGEEFAVLLPGTGLDEAIAIAERIRGVVENSEIAISEDDAICISVSIGVAVTDGAADACLDGLLAASDTALYRAKSKGRNVVHVA
ncbi:MAG: diguanylate cyclase [Rhizobiaceae bacterium]|nr:diguanylate cyclase [Rhizobiaceae bacterium]